MQQGLDWILPKTYTLEEKNYYIPKKDSAKIIYALYKDLFKLHKNTFFKKRDLSLQYKLRLLLNNHNPDDHSIYWFTNSIISDMYRKLSKKKFKSVLEKEPVLKISSNILPAEKMFIGSSGKAKNHFPGEFINFISEIHNNPEKEYIKITINGKIKIFFPPEIFDKHLGKYTKPVSTNNIIEKLVSAGIPEEALHENKGLWETLESIEKNDFVSKNQTFYVKDSVGDEWLLKLTMNEQGAFLESAAHYYLSEEFDFILPGKFPEPIKSEGVYITMQKSEYKTIRASQNLDYWLNCFALFHNDAKKILEKHKVDVPAVTFRSAKHEKDRHPRIKKLVDLSFDEIHLEDAINYLLESGHKRLIHNDVKQEHLIGKYLVDLELIGTGHPGLDLSMLLMQYHLPVYAWDEHLKKYLEFKGVESSFEEEFKELKQGVLKGAYVAIYRELISTPFRFPEINKLSENQEHLLAYLT
ncbi:aminoglycoside phosphotransferase family protein [Candidatus Woesearchaeota archaeon]|nr:aminoglycoside phosphotransferase family protein [Candidatus Woesearchaeota archaeon]